MFRKNVGIIGCGGYFFIVGMLSFIATMKYGKNIPVNPISTFFLFATGINIAVIIFLLVFVWPKHYLSDNTTHYKRKSKKTPMEPSEDEKYITLTFKYEDDTSKCEDDTSPQTNKSPNTPKVGDKHPTEPWVWTEYAPGKFDWRLEKGNGITYSKPKTDGESDAIKELNSLIGLDAVKEEISKLQNFIKIQLVRQAQGLKTSPISFHCVFTGNPGTGKTTVARIVAEIYRDMGILRKGHLVETDRSGLIGEYVGQTAVKTNNVVDSALDGVLFIDEAYTLAPSSTNDYAGEAVATLLKRMEDNRDRLVVILAGYSKEMQAFIETNSGLRSRFNRYIHFDDYSVNDLTSIFELHLNKNQYTMTDGAKALLINYLGKAVAHKDKNFGNGRFVRNIFEKTLQNQASRLSTINNLSMEELQLITESDIPTE